MKTLISYQPGVNEQALFEAISLHNKPESYLFISSEGKLNIVGYEATDMNNQVRFDEMFERIGNRTILSFIIFYSIKVDMVIFPGVEFVRNSLNEMGVKFYHIYKNEINENIDINNEVYLFQVRIKFKTYQELAENLLKELSI